MKTYTIVVKNPGKEAVSMVLNNATLSTLQSLVGGYIEVLVSAPHKMGGQHVVVYINEEGHLKGLKPNTWGVVGPIVVAGITPRGETVGLMPAAVEEALTLLNS